MTLLFSHSATVSCKAAIVTLLLVTGRWPPRSEQNCDASFHVLRSFRYNVQLTALVPVNDKERYCTCETIMDGYNNYD